MVWYTLWTSTIEQYSDTNFESVFRYELETNTNYKPVWYELHTRYKLQTSILMQLWYPQGMMFLVFLVALTPVSCRDLMDKILSSKTWQSKHIFRFWHSYGKASKTWVQNYIYTENYSYLWQSRPNTNMLIIVSILQLRRVDLQELTMLWCRTWRLSPARRWSLTARWSSIREVRQLVVII